MGMQRIQYPYLVRVNGQLHEFKNCARGKVLFFALEQDRNGADVSIELQSGLSPEARALRIQLQEDFAYFVALRKQHQSEATPAHRVGSCRHVRKAK
jgi:hypothetical protein